MNSVYYIESDNLFLIKNKLLELIKDKDYELSEFDLDNTLISEVIEFLDTYNFLCNHKLVVLYNPRALTSEKTKKDCEDLSPLEKYLDNPNGDNTLIIVSSSFDSKKKIVKKLKKDYEKIEVEINPRDYIKKQLKDYKFDNNVVDMIINYTNANINAIKNEVDKLKLYKEDDLSINNKDIEKVVHRIIDDSDNYIFELIDNISKRNIKRSIEIYNDLVFLGVDSIKLMVLLSNQIRLIYQVKVLANKSNDNDISKELGIHPYRVKLAREKGYNYSDNELISLLKKIATTDLKIKKGEINPKLGIELLILENA